MLQPTYFMTTHQMAIDTQACKLLAETGETKLTLEGGANNNYCHAYLWSEIMGYSTPGTVIETGSSVKVGHEIKCHSRIECRS